jgi:hypothetical protein
VQDFKIDAGNWRAQVVNSRDAREKLIKVSWSLMKSGKPRNLEVGA